MSNAMVSRRSQVTAELMELALELARDQQARALAAEDAAAAATLAGAFDRTARAVRRCVALGDKLERDAARAAREAAKTAADDHGREVAQRKQRLKAVVERHVCAEIHEDDACEAIDALDDLVDEDALDDAFLALPFEVQIARLRYDLQLDEAPAPETGFDPAVDPPRRRFVTPLRRSPHAAAARPILSPAAIARLFPARDTS